MKKKRILTVLLLLGGLLYAQSGEIARYAIFIGSNQGGQGRSTLRYAGVDAQGVAHVMEEIGGIRSSNRIILTDPDSQEIESGFSFLKTQVSRDKSQGKHTELFLYYSGHSDEAGLLLGEDLYPYSRLRSAIKEVGAEVEVAILDSCSSGAFTRTKGGRRGSPFLVEEGTKTEGHAFLTSSSESEASQESDRIGGSFFTHYLVTGLRGAADYSGDFKVTLNEAYRYAFDETLARTINTQAGPQHASYEIQLNGSGDLILTDLRQNSSQVLIQEDLAGRIFVQELNGRVVAELRKNQGNQIKLALPPENYQVTLDNGSDLQVAEIRLSRGSTLTLDSSHFENRTREFTVSRGNSPDTLEGEDADWENDLVKTTEELLKEIYKLKDSIVVSFGQKSQDPTLYQGLSLNFFPSNYRVEGASIGLISHVDEDLSGLQAGIIGAKIGRNVTGAQVSSIYNIAGGSVSLFQGAGVFNIAKGVRGVQASGVFNHSLGPNYGAQVAGVYNIAYGDSLQGQFSSVFNINQGSLTGIQVGGVFGIVSGNLSGGQISGLFNLTQRDTHGLQLSPLFNGTGSLRGGQISLINASGHMRGFQFGLVNVAGSAKGTQFGLLNISQEIKGNAIGLINISKNGLFHLSTWYDDRQLSYMGLQMGLGRSYNLLFGGLDMTEIQNQNITRGVWGYGLGFHVDSYPFWLDTDVSAKFLYNSARGDQFTAAPYFRLQGGLQLGGIALFAGSSLDIYNSSWGDPLFFHDEEPDYFEVANETFELYPSWFFGIRL